MQRFYSDFLALIKRWPGNHTPRFDSCRIEYEAALALGITEEQIISGTKYWLENCVPQDQSNFYPMAPHNFLREQSFMVYQPVDESSNLRVISDRSSG